ncbi:hypothetical protein [Streptomyces albireticuli]|uniref:Uncharacterized protein n=1 Tax=Streptomyces albireticuli TaxID=1940 RepID=A0A2A2D1G3_9ACTN|nr:hypothetical protein [Streptomyces albireticuli]MCD9145927.1 hypothetical protein [Streptomyces albireticuli]MCD9166097.1 hypothetical protein [Streptomyces albireticuli]MCD9196377.1 hypothetical protein [Streptomyces albireticuli]PAU45297.1 hypothetical protein CK936_30250 [Streptomyces albireticuli]
MPVETSCTVCACPARADLEADVRSGALGLGAAAVAHRLPAAAVRRHFQHCLDDNQEHDQDEPVTVTPVNVLALVLEGTAHAQHAVRTAGSEETRIVALRTLGDYLTLLERVAGSARSWAAEEETRADFADRMAPPPTVNVFSELPPNWCEPGSPAWERWREAGPRRHMADLLGRLGVAGAYSLTQDEAVRLWDLMVSLSPDPPDGRMETDEEFAQELAGEAVIRDCALTVLGDRGMAECPLETVLSGQARWHLPDDEQRAERVLTLALEMIAEAREATRPSGA